MKRILLAGVLAGIAMFVWTSIAHMTPLAKVGIREIPNEAAVLPAMKASMGTTDGLYLYPGFGLGPDASMKQMRDAMPAYEEKLKTGPSGILIYHPPGRPNLTGKMLGTEFVDELIEGILAIVLLSLTRLGSYGARVGFLVVLGVIAAMPTNLAFWNWYGFPASYTCAYMFIQVAGFTVAGLVGAAVLGRKTSGMERRTA